MAPPNSQTGRRVNLRSCSEWVARAALVNGRVIHPALAGRYFGAWRGISGNSQSPRAAYLGLVYATGG